MVTMRLLKKRGQPLLLLPSQPQLAARALELYPAQTPRSRLARMAAGCLLRTRLPIGTESVRVHLPPDDAFVRWLAALIPLPSKQTPQFAVLAGNPNSPGQRLIILLFGPTGQPSAVVKTGLTESARKLIGQEQQFLEIVPRPLPGIPPLRGTFSNTRLQALALDFLPGRSPLAQDEHKLPQVLSQWLHPQQQVAVAETRIWRELASTCVNHPIFKTHAPALQSRSCSAAVYHGDFAPWNVRVSPPGDWLVLDWERGEVNGVPAWDWFHYVVQKSILVQHHRAESVAASLAALLTSDEFQTYTQASGIAGHERALLLLYLLHHSEVVRPSEGLQVTHDLIKILATRWH